jgi:hypothetical protein
MTNTEAAKILERLAVDLHWNISGETSAAIGKAITALEHSPRIPEASELDDVPPEVAEVTGLECNVCHWRTLDTHRLLCDSCGGHELKPVYEVGKYKQKTPLIDPSKGIEENYDMLWKRFTEEPSGRVYVHNPKNPTGEWK